MTWQEEWRALAARIDGLIRAAEFLATAFKVNSSDDFRVVEKSLIPEFGGIIDAISQLRGRHEGELPVPAVQAIDRYLGQKWDERYFKVAGSGKVNIQAFAPLAAFRSEFEYLIRDSEVEGRTLTELAFEHLRRQIEVDDAVRIKWSAAYGDNELACEKLGAVHLLSHGIWAFKISAAGGATDLVFADPLDQHLQVAWRTARALVLTEWKLVRDRDRIETKAAEARDQASRYVAGVLGAVEVKRTRYVILVCETDLTPPGDVRADSVVYRHIVIPVSPRSPSVESTIRSRKG